MLLACQAGDVRTTAARPATTTVPVDVFAYPQQAVEVEVVAHLDAFTETAPRTR